MLFKMLNTRLCEDKMEEHDPDKKNEKSIETILVPQEEFL